MLTRDIFSALLFLTIVSAPVFSYAELSDKLVNRQIAVEKLTDRGESYDTNFSGWVGSMRIDIENQLISIAEFTGFDGRLVVVNGMYKITRIEKFPNGLNFECIDLDLGIEWHGKAWANADGVPRVEMVQKTSSRKWVNLSDYGKRFLKKNKFDSLSLGM